MGNGISSSSRYAIHHARATLTEFNERRHSVPSIFILASALEVGLVIVAGAIFVSMVIAALALVVWLVAGFVSASHP